MMKSISSLAVQVVLVIAIVLLFSFIDPFGILAPRKKTLENTPITVVSIRDIGQIVTAEYYGEVLSSLQEKYIEEVKAENIKTSSELKDLNIGYRDAIKKFYQAKDTLKVRWYRRKQDLLSHFYEMNSNLVNEVRYQEMVNVLLKKASYSTEGELLLAMWKGEAKDSTSFRKKFTLSSTVFDSLNTVKIAELTDSRNFKKRQIIVIGRGSVKAGIDFQEFSEKNFKYDKEKDVIYLFGVTVKILDCDINPWFIPEKKVKGFEIIAATNRANNPKYLLEVKDDCLKKLEAQARQNGIIEQARINAEQSLKAFFTLLLVEPVNEVRIMENYFDLYKDQFPAKDIVPKEKLMLIDSALLTLDRFARDSSHSFSARLSRQRWKGPHDSLLYINRYSYAGFRIAEDKVLSATDSAQLAQLMNGNYSQLDSIWFNPLEDYHKMYTAARTASMRGKFNSEAEFWFDSVRGNEDYVRYEKEFASLYRKKRMDAMQDKRSTARMQLIQFLQSEIKAVKRPDGRLIVKSNDTTAMDSVALYIRAFVAPADTASTQ